eukprot:3293177-Rhodomonas_salina.1
MSGTELGYGATRSRLRSKQYRTSSRSEGGRGGMWRSRSRYRLRLCSYTRSRMLLRCVVYAPTLSLAYAPTRNTCYPATRDVYYVPGTEVRYRLRRGVLKRGMVLRVGGREGERGGHGPHHPPRTARRYPPTPPIPYPPTFPIPYPLRPRSPISSIADVALPPAPYDMPADMPGLLATYRRVLVAYRRPSYVAYVPMGNVVVRFGMVLPEEQAQEDGGGKCRWQ